MKCAQFTPAMRRERDVESHQARSLDRAKYGAIILCIRRRSPPNPGMTIGGEGRPKTVWPEDWPPRTIWPGDCGNVEGPVARFGGRKMGGKAANRRCTMSVTGVGC